MCSVGMTAVTAGGFRDEAAQVELRRGKEYRAWPLMDQKGISVLVLPQLYLNVTLVSCMRTALGISPHATMSPDALLVHSVGNTHAAGSRTW